MVEVNQQDSFGDNICDLIAINWDPLALNIIKKYNQNLMIKNILGEIPNFSAFYSRRAEVVEVLWDLMESKTLVLQQKTFSDFTILHRATAYGDESTIRNPPVAIRFLSHTKSTSYQVE